MTTPAAPDNALKHIFDQDSYERVAELLRNVAPQCDVDRFLALSLARLDELSLMQRLRRMADSLHAVLPEDYPAALAILKAIAPDIKPAMVTLALPDYVARFGLQAFEASMDALKFFTPFGSSEFGVRPFIREDPTRALATITTWATHKDPHVRRLASEGTRPRLPWSFRLEKLAQEPELAAPILEALRADDSLYVRKSVANHLNDITKLHPDWVMDRLEQWPLDNPYCAWVARHALRTLIKRGDKRALAVIGADQRAEIHLERFAVTPQTLALGETLSLHIDLVSCAAHTQRLEIDYRMHYVRQGAAISTKVFKLRACHLAPGERLALTRKQHIRDFSTRKHYVGRHLLELMVNGDTLASAYFDLQ